MVDLTILEQAGSGCGVTLTDRQKDQVKMYLALLAKWNRSVSLTSVVCSDELLRFHFLEAFWAAGTFLRGLKTVADVGSGAGFPGMVIRICRPGLQVTLIEKNFKKSLFLKELTRRLQLPGEVFHGLAENYPAWGSIELAVIRALRPSANLLERLQKSSVALLLLCGHRRPLIEG